MDGLARLKKLSREGIRLEVNKKNRYLDVGDWHTVPQNYAATVHAKDPRTELLVLVHELVEFILCAYFGISPTDVDKEDELLNRGLKSYKNLSYWKYHLVATKIERLLCSALGLSWKDHTRNVNIAFREQEVLHNRKRGGV